jgi:ketosteroid isomerase-like protein
MKKNLLFVLPAVCLLLSRCTCPGPNGSLQDQESLKKTTKAIRDAFARGDVEGVLALHHPDVIKYFGGNNVTKGREAMRKGLVEMFENQKIEFSENTVESTFFNGGTAVETSIFEFKSTPKNGGPPSFARGRSMVTYIKYNDSPTGWASIREMAQGAPDKADSAAAKGKTGNSEKTDSSGKTSSSEKIAK